jgi:endonuclease YncB( thermonuclease family)
MAQPTPSSPSTAARFERAARPPRSRQRRRQWRMAPMTRARRRLLGGVLIACLGFAAIAAWERFTEPQGEFRDGPVAFCSVLQRRTCLIDGDTGRDKGEKWRLMSIDTPELSEPECDNERRLAVAARDTACAHSSRLAIASARAAGTIRTDARWSTSS